jgi:hypothetical protein
VNKRMIAAVLGAAALVVPATAVAKDDAKGKAKTQKVSKAKGKAKGKLKVKTATYILKGTYAGGGVVSVTGGNSFARKQELFGTDVPLNFDGAKFVVAETDLVAGLSLADVTVGDTVLVQAKGPRVLVEGSVLVARKLIDKTHPPVDEEETEVEPAPETTVTP